jgi:hypothetical protein
MSDFFLGQLFARPLGGGLGGGSDEDEDSQTRDPPEDEAAEQLDFDARPEEVVRRIERLAMWFIEQLLANQLPDFQVVSASPGRQRYRSQIQLRNPSTP